LRSALFYAIVEAIEGRRLPVAQAILGGPEVASAGDIDELIKKVNAHATEGDPRKAVVLDLLERKKASFNIPLHPRQALPIRQEVVRHDAREVDPAAEAPIQGASPAIASMAHRLSQVMRPGPLVAGATAADLLPNAPKPLPVDPERARLDELRLRALQRQNALPQRPVAAPLAAQANETGAAALNLQGHIRDSAKRALPPKVAAKPDRNPPPEPPVALPPRPPVMARPPRQRAQPEND
jgi:hypothetical protein